MPARILIWGAGAIGGSVGAWLKRAGHDISFVDVVADHVAAIRGDGLRITGPVEQFTVGVPAFLPEEVSGTWQHIFLAVKAQHTEAATRALTPHLAQDGYVLSLQNGLNELIIQRIVGAGSDHRCLHQLRRRLDGTWGDPVRQSRCGRTG